VQDLLFRQVQVFDGSGNNPLVADVGVRHGRIELVGSSSGEKAVRRVDGDGLALAPGFIDMHSHADLTLPAFPEARNSIQQGVTTEVVGNCGFSPAPVVAERADELRRYVHGFGPHLDWSWESFGEFLDVLDRRQTAVNVVALVGHSALRLAAMGMEDRAARPDELARMSDLLRQALADGAWGMSSGLVYPPSSFSPTDELIALARVLAERDGIYFSHIRGEGPTLLDSLAEAASIGEATGIRVQVSHLKAAGRAAWGRMPEAVAMLEAARKRGVRLHADAYPYTAGSTYLSQLLPPWSFQGGNAALVGRLRSEEQRARMRAEMERGGKHMAHQAIEFENVLINAVLHERNKRWEGLSVKQAAATAGADPFEFVFDLLADEQAGTVMVLFTMQEPDVRRSLSWSYTAIGSDQLGVFSDVSRVHPRTYGTFTRVLGHYARDEGLFPLQEAVRKMSGLPASILGLADRGTVEVGKVADLVLFDSTRVGDRSTYEEPTLAPAGVELVTVDGRVVVERGEFTGLRAGRTLRPATRAAATP
jgi:N-acyl-D-amino-acid deacylase